MIEFGAILFRKNQICNYSNTVIYLNVFLTLSYCRLDREARKDNSISVRKQKILTQFIIIVISEWFKLDSRVMKITILKNRLVHRR